MSKNKTKTIALLIAIAMLLTAFCACSYEKESDDNKLNIVTTVFPPYDFASQVFGDNAEITMLLGAGEESHSFEPTPKDMLAVSDCDLFIYIGGEEEKWAEDIIESLDSDVKTLCLRDCIPQDKKEKTGDDGHIWTSPKNAISMVDFIKDTAVETDNANKEEYIKNAEAYKEKLFEVDAAITAAVTNAKTDTLVFADRFPFAYLAADYGINYISVYPNCEENSEPSGAAVADVINKIKENNISYIFYIEFSSMYIADVISDETGAEKLLLHSAHTVSREEMENGITYADIYMKNAENIREALS